MQCAQKGKKNGELIWKDIKKKKKDFLFGFMFNDLLFVLYEKNTNTQNSLIFLN